MIIIRNPKIISIGNYLGPYSIQALDRWPPATERAGARWTCQGLQTRQAFPDSAFGSATTRLIPFTWRFMGYKSPNMGYIYSYLTCNPTYNSHEPPSEAYCNFLC